MQDSRLCVKNEGCSSTESSYIPHSGSIACSPVPDLRRPATKALHTIVGNNTHTLYSLELLMIGIKVPKIC